MYFLEVVHRIRSGVCSDYDLDSVWKLFWKPEGNICLFEIFLIYKMVDSLENEYDFIVNNWSVVDYLVFQFFIADVEPISEIFSKFFLKEFYFLSNI